MLLFSDAYVVLLVYDPCAVLLFYDPYVGVALIVKTTGAGGQKKDRKFPVRR